MSKRLAVAAMLLVMILPAAAPAAAQVQTGSIRVRVADQQGAVVPGVTVTLTGSVLVVGQVVGTTDALGIYRFPSLTPGTYSVKADLQGFQSVVRTNVIVSVGQTTPLDFALTVGKVAETITVSGESPTIDTTSANVNVTLSSQLLQSTPGGRDIWALAEFKVPGLVMSRPDVGGTSGGLQGTYTARGTTSAQNTQYLNGINVGDPAAIGAAGFYYDFDAFEDIQVSTGAHDITVPTSGVFLNMVTKSGGDTWAGQAAFYYEGARLQSGNVDDALLAYGFRPITGAVNFVSDGTLQFGGPLVKNKWRLFTSFRDWRVHVNTPAALSQTIVDNTDMTSGLVNLTYQLNNKNKVTGFYSRQYYKKPHRFLTSTTVPSTNFTADSISLEDDVFDVVQGLWNSIITPRLYMDARVSYNNINFPLKFNGTKQSLTDVSTGIVLNNEASQSLAIRRRLGINATFNYYLERALGGRHEFRLGFDHTHAPVQQETDRWGDVALSYRSLPSGNTPAGPTTVTLYNTPVTWKSVSDVTSLFLQDAYSVKHLTVTAGLRWERLNTYLPTQSSPPTQWAAANIGGFAALPRSFGDRNNVVLWHNFAPRISFVLDVTGNGKTTVRGSAARYFYVLASTAANNVNLNATYSETYNWKDLNGDLQYQAGEQTGTAVVSSAAQTSFDPGFRRPYTNEFTLGFDRELVQNVKFSTVLTYRAERFQQVSINTAAPFSVWPLRTAVDAGPDGVVGTADDGIASYFDRTVSATQTLITNDPGWLQSYRGLEFTVTKRMANRWQLLAGLTLSRSYQENLSLAASPNSLINTTGPITTDVPVQFKLTGTYILPWDIALAANLRSQSGTPYNRQLSVPLTLTGSTTINIEPYDGRRLPSLTTLGIQASKNLRFGKRALTLFAMVDNVTNANTTWAVRSLTGRSSFRQAGDPTGQLNAFPQFETPTNVLGPRIARFGVSFKF